MAVKIRFIVVLAVLTIHPVWAAPLRDEVADRIAAGEFRTALAGLDSLLASGNLSADDRKIAEIQRALCWKELGRASEALTGFEAAHDAFPVIEDLLFLWEGESLEALNRPEAAAARYDLLVKRFPGCRFRDDVRLRTARIDDRAGRAEAAERRYREIAGTARDADDIAEALFGLASAQSALNQPARALETRRSLVHDHPGSRWALKALPLLGDPATAADRYDRGQVCFRHGQWADAAAAFKSLSSRNPADGRVGLATYWEGRSHFAAKEYAPALAAFTAAHRKHRVPDALFYLGRCAVRADDDRVGADRLVEFARKYPDRDNADDALWFAAWSLERLSDFEGARKAYLRLAAAYPRSRNVEQSRFRSGFVLYSAGRLREAIRALTALGDTSQGYLRDQAYYWAGKCHEKLGDAATAGKFYARAARSFPASYYAARAALTLPLEERDAMARSVFGGNGASSPGEPSSPPDTPGWRSDIRRGDLLARLGRYRDAEREFSPIERANDDSLPVLRGLLLRYERIRAFDRALRVASRVVELEQRAGSRLSAEVLQRLYPTYYLDLIRKPAGENGVEPAMVLAIIRQESAFDPASVSGPGARGLMQIMPATGAAWAADMGIRNFTPRDLDDPATSIRYGCREIATYLPQFSKDLRGLALALSSYNAGLNVAQKWDRTLSRDVDELVENVPYHETRGYIKSVVRNYEVYKLLLREVKN